MLLVTEYIALQFPYVYCSLSTIFIIVLYAEKNMPFVIKMLSRAVLS